MTTGQNKISPIDQPRNALSIKELNLRPLVLSFCLAKVKEILLLVLTEMSIAELLKILLN